MKIFIHLRGEIVKEFYVSETTFNDLLLSINNRRGIFILSEDVEGKTLETTLNLENILYIERWIEK